MNGVTRRSVLEYAAGAGIGLGVAGVAASTRASAQTAGGELAWEFTEPEYPVYSGPTIADGRVFVGTGSFSKDHGTLYAVDAATGDRVWAFDDPEGGVSSPPTVADGVVFAGDGEGDPVRGPRRRRGVQPGKSRSTGLPG